MKVVVVLGILSFFFGVITTAFFPTPSMLPLFPGHEILSIVAFVLTNVFVIALMPLFATFDCADRVVIRWLGSDSGQRSLTRNVFPLWALLCLLSAARSFGTLAVAVMIDHDASVMGSWGIVLSIEGLISVRLASGKWWPGFTMGGDD